MLDLALVVILSQFPLPTPMPLQYYRMVHPGDGPVLTNLLPPNTNVGTTDARFDAEALGWKFEGFCSKAHTKAGTSCMSDSRDTQPFCDWSYPCHSTHSSRTFLCVRALHMRLISLCITPSCPKRSSGVVSVSPNSASRVSKNSNRDILIWLCVFPNDGGKSKMS